MVCVAVRALLVLLAGGGYLASGITHPNFISRKVASSFNSPVSSCTLRSVRLAMPTIRACAALCHLETNCKLYCLKDDVCTLSSALVNIRYPGGDPNDPIYTGVLTYDRCYSTTWSFSDVTQYIQSVDSSSIFDPDFPAVDAVNGFYCYGPLFYCFIGNLADPRGWWTADLGAPRRVSTVRVWTRADNHLHPMFNYVDISLGNSSDYNNPVFDTFPAEPPTSGMIVTFTASPPVTGQYLKLKSEGGPHPIAICHIEILE
ncbi:uncharacterized protein [Panulirus ornatus]|uniref:uncharacterized protein n=1 Tax=Panulirus ornatus TaxID=150431 RepID=UPI003A883DF6